MIMNVLTNWLFVLLKHVSLKLYLFNFIGNMLIEGTILINGRQIGNYMKFLSGFMHQEDIFVPYLTVREHMNIMVRIFTNGLYSN